MFKNTVNRNQNMYIRFYHRQLYFSPSTRTTFRRRCNVAIFTSQRRSTIWRRCNKVAKKASIKRRLHNVVILLLKWRSNYDRKTVLLYCCLNDVVITIKNNVVILLLKRRCNYDSKTTALYIAKITLWLQAKNTIVF